MFTKFRKIYSFPNSKTFQHSSNPVIYPAYFINNAAISVIIKNNIILIWKLFVFFLLKVSILYKTQEVLSCSSAPTPPSCSGSLGF